MRYCICSNDLHVLHLNAQSDFPDQITLNDNLVTDCRPKLKLNNNL
jgi:hypothetical protein